MAVDSLQSKKLRIKSAAIPTQVLVVQDGTASDGTATIKIDNGFRDGYTTALVTANSMKRAIFDVEEMTCSRTGKEFTFSVQDFTNRNSFALGPGDRVEFWALNAAITPTQGSFPAWHSGAQGAVQDKLFFGFVIEVKRVQRGNGYNRFQIRCVDSIEWSNRIKLQLSVADDVSIPVLIFNPDQPDDADFFYAIKNYDKTDSDPAVRFGYGWPKKVSEAQMTLADILRYLQSAYQADLYDRGLIDGASDDLFDDTEIEQFDSIYPPKIVFERTGFGDAVRSLIAGNAPDFDVVCDPRTKKWRFIPTARDIVAGPFATISSVTTAKKKWVVDDVTLFATSGTGSSVRLQSLTDPRASEVATVTAIGANTVEITTISNYAFTTGDIIVPMYAASARPPVLTIDLENDCAENTLEIDLRGVFTAVSIVGRNQKSSKVQIGQSASSNLAASLQKAYDTAYEANFRPEHANRRTDRGADGFGIEIREIETLGSGDDAFTRIYFSEDSSQYLNDHDVQNNSVGESEWTGTAFHLLTVSAAVTNVESNNVSAIITHFSRAGWIDAAQTVRRFRIDLDRNIKATAPTVKGSLTDSTTGDRFEMTSSDVFAPTNYNKRGIVGNVWKVASTTVDDDARYLDSNGCPEYAQFRGINGQTQSVPAVPAERAVENAPTREKVFNRIGGALIEAPQRIFFLKPPDTIDYAALCAKYGPPTYTAPPTLNLTMTATEHEVLEARVPDSGFSGTAYLWHKHAEELQIVSDKLEHESQLSQFESIAAAIHARVSEPHFSGDLTLNGCTKWHPLADLGFRTIFGAGYTGIVSGVVTEQSRFWGLVQTVRYDWKGGRTTLNFSSTSGDTVRQAFFESQFVSTTAKMREIEDRLRKTERLANCAITRDTPKPAQTVDGCNVSHQSQSVSRRITVIDPKQTAIGTGETALGSPSISGGGVSANSASIDGTHSFNGALIVERDFLGRPFGVINPTGALLGGVESGKKFIPSFVEPAKPTTLPQYVADTWQEIGAAILGIDLQTPKASTLVETAAGSTTTVIQLANPIPDDGRYVGGFIEFRGGRTARPKYTIASHTSRTVTLTGAMSEAAPGAGLSATVWAARIPDLDPTDFPAGGRPFKDGAGSWFVATGGQIVPANLSGSTLSKTTGTTAPSLGIVTKKDYETRLIDWELWIDFSAGRNHDANTGSIANTNPSYATAGTYNAAMAYYGWADTQKRGNLIQFMVPKDLDTTQAITIELVAELSGSVSSGNTIVISGDFRAVADKEAAETGGVTNSVKVAKNIESSGYASLNLLRMDLGTMFAANTLDPGDFVHGVVYRDTGSDAADTYTGTVRAIGVVVRGKRRLGGSTNDGNKIGGADGEDTARSYLLGTF